AAQATRVSAAFPESCNRLQHLDWTHHYVVANHPQAGEHHARRLREADAKRWTQEAVGALLGVDQATVSKTRQKRKQPLVTMISG
ncbi:MAG: helix-turn-helix domain-containing protein, partial [Planctomycetaceae bacterium]|nr:helix-turn-helix domain-containing protein [Planctomycetaceae bacterium]